MADFWDRHFACAGWSDDKIDRFNAVWTKIKDPKSNFNWKEFFPLPKTAPDWAKAVAKSTFPVMIGGIQRQTVISKVMRHHQFLVDELKENVRLTDAMSIDLNTHNSEWIVLNSGMTDEQLFIVIMILERITYGIESPLRDWNASGFVKWLSVFQRRQAVAYRRKGRQSKLVPRFA